jgi:hypothetical protein
MADHFQDGIAGLTQDDPLDTANIRVLHLHQPGADNDLANHQPVEFPLDLNNLYLSIAGGLLEIRDHFRCEWQDGGFSATHPHRIDPTRLGTLEIFPGAPIPIRTSV